MVVWYADRPAPTSPALTLVRPPHYGQNAIMISRRHFIASAPVVVAAAAAAMRRGDVCAMQKSPSLLSDHPTPRPGITAAKVLKGKQLTGEHADAAPVFDMVRQIPHIIDGIRCQCGCAELEGNYSLLSCYEGHGMAGHCQICQGEARLAYRLHKQGKSLDQIRAAIDAKYG